MSKHIFCVNANAIIGILDFLLRNQKCTASVNFFIEPQEVNCHGILFIPIAYRPQIYSKDTYLKDLIKQILILNCILILLQYLLSQSQTQIIFVKS